MDKNKIPFTDFTGDIEIQNISIPCAVLFPESENPLRVLVQREVVGLLTGNKKGGLSRYLKPKNLQNYIPEKFKNKLLSDSTHSFRFKNRMAQGFEATDLIDLCEMYINAQNDNVLLPSQRHLAKQAQIIVMAFAKTGIIAIIDEVTGYQEIRARRSLEKILEEFISKELNKWAKTFPDEFYKHLFRLRGWQYVPFSVKRPKYVGTLTNDIVYERLAPKVLHELKKLNPKTDKGFRKHKYHQWLTQDIGHPRLREHITAVIALMKASTTWSGFHRLLQRALPKQNDTIELLLEDKNGRPI